MRRIISCCLILLISLSLMSCSVDSSNTKNTDIIQTPYIGMPISDINNTMLGEPTETDLSEPRLPRYYWYYDGASFYAEGIAYSADDLDDIRLHEAYATIKVQANDEENANSQSESLYIPFFAANINKYSSIDKLEKDYKKNLRKLGIGFYHTDIAHYWNMAHQWFEYYNEHVEDIY